MAPILSRTWSNAPDSVLADLSPPRPKKDQTRQPADETTFALPSDNALLMRPTFCTWLATETLYAARKRNHEMRMLTPCRKMFIGGLNWETTDRETPRSCYSDR